MSSSNLPPQSCFVRRAFPIAMILLGGCAASASGDRAPVPAIAESAEAQREFDDLELRWQGATELARLELDPRLGDFLRRYGVDPVARRVRVYLAWNSLARGELARADRLLLPVLGGSPGVVRDQGIVVAAAIALKRGQATRALALLEPLEGKIIEDSTHESYSEQRALAAIATRRWDLAVDTLEDWLVGLPPPLRPTSEPRARAILGQLPLAELGRQLERLSALVDQAPADGPDTEVTRWLRDALRQRLVSSALVRRDAKLAQRLVGDGTRSKRSEERSALLELAGEAEADPVVRGRTVGLALYAGDSRRRHLSAAITEGLTLALGLPRRGESPDAPRLLIREVNEHESAVQTLRALAGEGAAILIAGVDTESADLALGYVDPDAAPLLLLAAPTQPLPKGMPVFSLGLPGGAEERATNEVLSRLGTEQVAFVGFDDECESQAVDGTRRFPMEEWRHGAIDAVAVLGPSDCARSLGRELMDSGLRPTVLFGLESASAYGASVWSGRSVWLTVGHFPLSARQGLPAELSGIPGTFGWYQSLGYDAGTIANAALHALPTVLVEADREVIEIHHRASAALLGANVTLITTFAGGFSDGRVLNRELEPVVRGG